MNKGRLLSRACKDSPQTLIASTDHSFVRSRRGFGNSHRLVKKELRENGKIPALSKKSY